jgi:hypothetical protein
MNLRQCRVIAAVSSLVVMAGLCLSLALAAPAQADPYADCRQGTAVCRPDTNPDHWCFGQTTEGRPVLRSSIQWAIDNADNTTDITTSFMSSCSATADARWRESGLGQGILGQYICTDWAGASYPEVCYSSDVVINMNAHDYVADDPSNIIPSSDGNVEPGEIALNVDMSTCHEFGHHLGLAHHNVAWYQDFDNDCMRNEWLEAEQANAGWRKYNGHHRDHINAHY